MSESHDRSTGLPLTEERSYLRYPDDPDRRIGVRVERWNEDHGTTAESASKPVAVLVHGFKGFMDWGFFPYLSMRFAASGFVVVSMNTSGSGVGDDPLEMDDDEAFFRDTYSRQLEDIAAVRAFARGLPGVDARREILFGHSRGGGMAVISAAEDTPAAVATWAAIDDTDRFDDATKERWRRDGVLNVPNARTGQVHRMSVAALDDFETNAERLDILSAASRLTVPLLAVHGTSDPSVDPVAAHRISERVKLGEALLVAGADHVFGASHPLANPDDIRALQSAIEGTLVFALQHAGR